MIAISKKRDSDLLLTALVIMGILIQFGLGVAQTPPPDSTDIQRAKVRALMERFRFRFGYGGGAGVQRDGRIIGLERLELNIGLTSRDPVERIYQFLERHEDLFGMQNPRQELVLRGNGFRGNSGRVRFEQVVGEIPVRHGFFDFMLEADSGGPTISSLQNNYYPAARDVNTSPSITMEQAEQIALADTAHEGKSTAIYGTPQLMIADVEEALHLVWYLDVDGGGYMGASHYLIDAHTGQVLYVRSSIKTDFR